MADGCALGRPSIRTGETLWVRALAPLALFLIALALRSHFYAGFVLGDDAEEFLLAKHISLYGVDFQVYQHLEYRFPLYVFNLLCFRWLGPSELGFFLPTLLMSASLSPIAYFILRFLGHGLGACFLGALVVATAPFEILIGTVRANDLILSWFLALALLAWVALPRRPVSQGIALAILGWLAFYTKLWAVYLLPPLALYYAIRIVRHAEWRGSIAFVLVSMGLHVPSALLWRHMTGSYLPFLSAHSATYPVEPEQLARVLLEYPRLLFAGSQEFGTTLFGSIPYLLLVLLAIKAFGSLRPRLGARRPRLDRVDLALVLYYGSFFLLLEFFPTTFEFDRYYSVPRIFRYMTPLSFPIALHVAKLLIDVGRSLDPRSPAGRAGLVAALGVVVLLNLHETAEATEPGRIHSRALAAAVAVIERDCPPQVLVSQRVGAIVRHVHLEASCPGAQVGPYLGSYWVSDYEQWLAAQSSLPEGTLLVTGLASYVHYGCHGCGFRLEQMSQPLDDRWVLVEEGESLSYLPRPEPLRIWRWSRSDSPPR